MTKETIRWSAKVPGTLSMTGARYIALTLDTPYNPLLSSSIHMLKLKSLQTSRPGRVDLFIAWVPALLWMAVIYYFSSLNTWTTADGPPAFKAIRKSAHVFEYGVLALLIGHALWTTWLAHGRARSRALMSRVWWVGVMLCTLYAFSDELHQAFVPRREFHLTDILIDGLSATAALGIWYIVRARKRSSIS